MNKQLQSKIGTIFANILSVVFVLGAFGLFVWLVSIQEPKISDVEIRQRTVKEKCDGLGGYIGHEPWEIFREYCYTEKNRIPLNALY